MRIIKKILKYTAIAFVALIFIITIFSLGEIKENIAAEKEKTAQANAEKERKAEAEKVKGFHCLSILNGANRDLIKDVKQYMNDPNSFKHLETRISPVNNKGFHNLSMDFTGKNIFNATVRQKASATARNSDCSITLIDIK